MRKVLFGVIITLIVLFTYKYCDDDDKVVLQQQSVAIQEQLKNVGKLVVTEGHFSEIFDYSNSKEIFGDFFTSEKKALVVVNAEVSIGYDLDQIDYEIDNSRKILTITSIPEAEVTINPDIEYYDVQDGLFNPFEAEDYNNIKDKVKLDLETKIANSKLKKNAQNRLLSELSKFYALTSSMGWTLQYNEDRIESIDDFNILKY